MSSYIPYTLIILKTISKPLDYKLTLIVDYLIVIATSINEGIHAVNKPPERPSKSKVQKDHPFNQGFVATHALEPTTIISWINETLGLWALTSLLRDIDLEVPPQRALK